MNKKLQNEIFEYLSGIENYLRGEHNHETDKIQMEEDERLYKEAIRLKQGIINLNFKSMYTIRKSFEFSASHQLSGLPKEHPCSRLHGHNYIVVVELQSETLDPTGFIVDYRQLDDLKRWIDNNLDHKHLNDFFGFNPTAENMAEFMFAYFSTIHPEINAIEVSETPKTNARYSKKA